MKHCLPLPLAGYFQEKKIDLSEGAGGVVPLESIEERRLSISRSSASVKRRCLSSHLGSVLWPWVPPLGAAALP